MQETVELNDVQGIIMKGYGVMPFAKYLMVHFNDAAQAKTWLGQLMDDNTITDAKTSTKTLDRSANIGFTNHGMVKIGMDADTMNSFSREFEEGMVSPHRNRMLGDQGDNAPDKWEWGNPNHPKRIHGVFMLYATNEANLQDHLSTQKNKLAAANIDVLHELDTKTLPERKEHFGFHDGIAQPVMKGAGRNEAAASPGNLINPGEFIYGYKNEYDKYPFSPNVTASSDAGNLLQPDKNDPSRKDVGRNGSMLVFRTMSQDVKQFWDFMEQAANAQQVENTSETKEHLAAKMVGRWPNGSPLTLCPHQASNDPKMQVEDKFGYAKDDYDGTKCPIGSHIRRTNPRDNFVRDSSGDAQKDMDNSNKFMKRFRIMRRGRAYGEPLSPTLDPQEIVDNADDGAARGLHFLCVNASIGRQFELMQQTWVNNPKFAGLYNDSDPIIGQPEILDEIETTNFTEQAVPLRKRVTSVPRFTAIKGGAYFFLPGMAALKYLAKA